MITRFINKDADIGDFSLPTRPSIVSSPVPKNIHFSHVRRGPLYSLNTSSDSAIEFYFSGTYRKQRVYQPGLINNWLGT